ncbi:hypothetical protein DFH27DRAFT_388322 [Peziza echinospora]|nr:hypothetical protein DFH27DRAFT_388322 [Peziza echinospora]
MYGGIKANAPKHHPTSRFWNEYPGCSYDWKGVVTKKDKGKGRRISKDNSTDGDTPQHPHAHNHSHDHVLSQGERKPCMIHGQNSPWVTNGNGDSFSDLSFSGSEDSSACEDFPDFTSHSQPITSPLPPPRWRRRTNTVIPSLRTRRRISQALIIAAFLALVIVSGLRCFSHFTTLEFPHARYQTSLTGKTTKIMKPGAGWRPPGELCWPQKQRRGETECESGWRRCCVPYGGMGGERGGGGKGHGLACECSRSGGMDSLVKVDPKEYGMEEVEGDGEYDDDELE